jgi:hypothetical protein
LHGRYLLAVAVTADGLLVGASSGHASRDGGLYRFSGGVFNQCEEGLPDGFGGAVSPRHLAARGRDAVVSLPGGNVYTSANGGRSWSQIAADLPGVSEVALRSIANQVA